MGEVKTTLEIPDQLFRRTKATAALRGESLKDFVTAALGAYLESESTPSISAGWRSVFGKAPQGATAEVDQILEDEFERVDPDTWR